MHNRKLTLKKTKTERGFSYATFADGNDTLCSIQRSSIATQEAIWVGCAKPNAMIMARDAAAHGVETEQRGGWVPYPIPDAVILDTRMHLTRKQAGQLAVVLAQFAETGTIE